MPLHRKIFAGLFLVIAAMLAVTLICLRAAVGADDNQEIQFPATSINHHDTSLSLDTGSSSVVIWLSSAKRLELKAQQFATADIPADKHQSTTNVSWLSESARLAVGQVTVDAPLPVLDAAGFDGDGIIGWPEVRDGLLVFDTVHRTVIGTNALPAETAHWVKLKIHRGDQLFLDLPLPNGKTGIVLVDTGSPAGLSLEPTAWKAWRQAHSRARTVPRIYHGLSGASWSTPWARSVTIPFGPITFTNVDVGEASDSEMDGLPAGYAGTIGLAALGRLNFCVDGPNGFVYVQPRPAEPRTPAALADWTVDDSVRLRGDTLLVDSAGFKYFDSDYPGAIEELNRALQINSNNAAAWDLRGDARARIGEYGGAIADATRALQLDPKNEDAWQTRGGARADKDDWNGAIADYNQALALDTNSGDAFRGRGLAREGKNDWKGALADLTRSIQLQSNSSDAWLSRAAARQNHADFRGALSDYNQAVTLTNGDTDYAELYRQLLLLRLQKPGPAFATNLTGWKDGWSKNLGKFITGQLTEPALLTAADTKDVETVSGQHCEAWYFIGMMRLSHGDRPGAIDSLQKCLATGERDYFEFSFARAELARLNASPSTRSKR